MDDSLSDATPLREAFRERFRADRERGGARALREYLDLFPGAEDVIAREYLALREEVLGDDDTLAATRTGLTGFQPVAAVDGIGPYRLESELGAGGQGIVYLARDARLGRRVALKVLKVRGLGAAEMLERFRREAAVASQLDDPGICTVYEAGVDGDIPYIAMRYVEGHSLAESIALTRADDPSTMRLSFETEMEPSPDAEQEEQDSGSATVERKEIARFVRFFERAARSLHAAHEAGVVHRDIKPGNIMVALDGNPVIMDFGLARSDDESLPTLTETGDVFGTPAYMSPEQIDPSIAGIDRRTDIWSLGVTMFESLTGVRPFAAATRAGLYRSIFEHEPKSPRRLNPFISTDLSVVVLTALEKSLDRRYATAEALADDLAAVNQGRPTLAQPVGLGGRLVRWCRREPKLATLACLILLALPVIATLGTYWWLNREDVLAFEQSQLRDQQERLLEDAYLVITEGVAADAVPLLERARQVTKEATPEADAGVILALYRDDPKGALAELAARSSTLGGTAAGLWLEAALTWRLGDKAGADDIWARIPQPTTELDHFVIGLTLVVSGDTGGRADWGAAVEHLQSALMISDGRRALYVQQLAHAAGHERNVAVARRAANALMSSWPDRTTALFWAAFALREIGDLHRAAEILERLHERGEGGLRTRHDLSRVKLALGDEVGGEAMIRSVLAEDANDLRANSELGKLLLDRGDAAAALPHLAICVRLAGNATYHSNYATALARTGRYEDGRDYLLRIRRARPLDVRLLCEIGVYVSNEGGTLAEGLQWANKALAIEPAFVEASRNKAICLLGIGQAAEAIPVLEGLVTVPGSIDEDRTMLADAYRRTGQVKRAERTLHAAAARYPDSARVAFALGYFLTTTGRGDPLPWLEKAARLDPNNAEAWVNMGTHLQAIGRLDEAEKALRRALAINPDLFQAHYNLAMCFRGRRKYADALPHLQRAIDLSKREPQVLVANLITLLDLGRLGPARTQLEEIKKAGLRSWRVVLHEAKLLAREGDLIGAAATWRRGVEADPESASLLTGFGEFLDGTIGDSAQALLQYEAAVRVAPDDGSAWAITGRLRRRLGLAAAGVSALEKSVSLGGETSGSWWSDAKAALQEARSDVAQDRLASVLERARNPQSASVGERIALHEWLLGRGRATEANAMWERLLKDQPRLVHAHFVEASIAMAAVKPDAARSWLLAALNAIAEAHDAGRVREQHLARQLTRLLVHGAFDPFRSGESGERWKPVWELARELLSRVQ